ncbi:MAG: hypothetical protein JSV18_03895 [Candidatus Bathyarchaeota archaeon]|nr:MAG: hypothetical protein JSV18_03895 [Candidatus Bathyarchaeota archaeon]
MRVLLKITLIVVLIATVIPTIAAHTPLKLDEGNHSPETAFEIPNPTKSWTLYRELHEAGELEYYLLRLDTGERLAVSVYTPTNEAPDFSPTLILMSPGKSIDASLPGFVEVPLGYGAALLESERPEKPEYEPFTPGSYYFLIDLDLPIEEGGNFYIAIYEPAHEGRYGIAIGYVETFTPLEWIRVPLDAIGIHRWEGQPLILILAPIILALLGGLAVLWVYGRLQLSPFSIAGVVSSLLYIGSCLVMLTQMSMALIKASSTLAAVTAIFALLPLALGYMILRKALGLEEKASRKDRALMASYGILGLLTWSGLIIGPALAFLASVLPHRGAG